MADLNVGDLFKVTEAREWIGPTGSGLHKTQHLVRITEVGEFNASWVALELLEESGKPPDIDTNVIGLTGGFAIRFLPDLIAEGIYERAEERP